MNQAHHIRIIIFAVLVCIAASCRHVQRFDSREFIIANDTLCLDSYAYPLSLISLNHAVRYDGSYYCLFDKKGSYRGMYDRGIEPFMLEISDDATVIRQLPSPDYYLIWSDFFVRSDTLFWKNQFEEACYWEDNAAEWVPVKALPDIVYEDTDWQIAVRDGGEFGVFTWFIDRHTDRQYIYPILPERINRIDSTFYLTGKNAIMTLSNPRQGLQCDEGLRYENTLGAEYQNSTSVQLNVNIWSNGFQPSMLPDTLFRTDSIELITSFSIDKTLFTVANAKDRTFIASIIDGELKEEFSFNEKLMFVDVSDNMDSRNQQDSGALLKYHKGKYEMGLIDIDGYSIRQLHMYYNPDTLTFSRKDHLEMVINRIKKGWDTLSFRAILDIESNTGSREVQSLKQNSYIPNLVKDRSSRRRFIQQVDSSLVFERSYWISEDDKTVMACFMDLYLNDVHKEMPSEMFDSIYDTIKDVMGCESTQTRDGARNSMIKVWETPTMVLEYYPYRSDDNIRIALWRKEPCHGISSQEHQFCVKETRITREEFIHAYQHRFEYNQVRDTTLDWFTRKKVEVAVFRTLTDEEKEAYIWTDYGIQNIGRYPTGEYIADLGYANWKGAVFVDDNSQADSTVINGSDRATYSKTGIYVGCKGFDCDDIAWLYFYRRKDGKLSRMEEIAVYINNNWRLPWYEDSPEFEGLDYNNAMVWHEDALYCFGVENYDDENGKWCVRPIFLKLELLPI